MNLGRTFRTVRHLTAEQWFLRAVCRGRWLFARRFPEAFRRRIDATADKLPRPRSDTAALAEVAKYVLQLQSAVHGDHLDGIPAGRFHFLGRTVDFSAFDRVEWRRDLGEGNNRLWRMNLSYFGWAVPLLARGTPEGLRLAHQALAQLKQQNPWSIDGVFRDVWHPYSASHRLINLLAGLSLYRAAGGAQVPATEADLLDHVRLCAAFVLRNLERDLQFNHLLKNYVALAVYSAALDRPCGELSFLQDDARRSVSQVVLTDGGHAERSPMYHALGLIDLRTLRAGLSAQGGAGWLDPIVASMEKALGVVTHPDGDIALLNDSWLGEAPPARALAPAPAEGMSAIPVTGYVRLGGGRDALIFDCGPCGPESNPGHAHADFLSVELSVGARRFLVDPGVPTYSAGRLRDASRSASQHNGPHVAGAEPIEFWHSFRVGHRGHARLIDNPALAGVAPLWTAGCQDGYLPLGIDVARWAGLWPGRGALLVDIWKGPAGQRAASRFLVPAQWQLTGDREFVAEGTRVAFDVLMGTPSPAQTDVWWPRFGESNPAHALEVSSAEHGGLRVAATAWRWGGELPVTIDIVSRIANELGARIADRGRQ